MFSALQKVTRNAHVWLPGYLKARAARPSTAPKRAWLAIADHYEPGWGKAELGTQRRRVRSWEEAWPRIASRHCDAEGKPPQYTFFFPEEQYHPELLEPLRRMTEAGIADVEVHIHHGGEGEQKFLERMSRFLEYLEARHGLLRRHNLEQECPTKKLQTKRARQWLRGLALSIVERCELDHQLRANDFGIEPPRQSGAPKALFPKGTCQSRPRPFLPLVQCNRDKMNSRRAPLDRNFVSTCKTLHSADKRVETVRP
jgi:hypothetical protein